MRRAATAFMTAGGLAAFGCAGLDTFPETVSKPPASAGRPIPSGPAASVAVAQRVDMVGRRVVAANPQIGARPLFRVIGSPDPEIFHRGTSDIVLTEGLVKQCATDGQLAAVLCGELGKMVAEREANAPPKSRRPDRRPPMEVPMAGDRSGGAADMVRQRELAEVEGYDPRDRPAVPPDPTQLAYDYHARAGYQAGEIAAAWPLFDKARGASGFEKQMSAPASAAPPPG